MKVVKAKEHDAVVMLAICFVVGHFNLMALLSWSLERYIATNLN